jgi:hypothetical protein
MTVEVDFSAGFSQAPSRARQAGGLGGVPPSLLQRIAAAVQPGPAYIGELADRLEEYFRNKERIMANK